MNKTKIDWCDSTWNPVTGCLHNCEYCYARSIATRFGNFDVCFDGNTNKVLSNGCIELGTRQNNPYPAKFTPTLHRYHLEDYKNKKTRNIFVCSMADLFGEWVPNNWLEEVFAACKIANQHNYLFLTKNPSGYKRAISLCNEYYDFLNRLWFGISLTEMSDRNVVVSFLENTNDKMNRFLSIEPILEEIDLDVLVKNDKINWIIIGAETGNRKDKVVPKREWIEKILNYCRKKDIPCFMKNSLLDVWGEPLVREFPLQLQK